MADAYLSQSAPGVTRAITPDQAYKMAKLAAQKALDRDNTLSESYNSLGLISSRYEWNWSEAENHFRTAIKLDPEFLPPRLGLINTLRLQKKFDEALADLK